MIGIKERKGAVGTRGNVMTPITWIAGVCETSLNVILGFSPTIDDDKWWAIFYLVIGILAFWTLAYMFFAVRDPQRLQTEHFQLEHQRIKVESMKRIEAEKTIDVDVS